MISINTMIEAGVCSAGLRTMQFPAAKRRRHLPNGHQDREIPGNDLTHDAERLMEMIGDGVVDRPR